MITEKKTYGNIGENLATKYLENKGYKIVCQNFSNKLGEIDIIAKDKDYIVFVEVKARHSAKYGLPREAVTLYKQNKIRMVALSYLKTIHKLDSNCRFDVIEIFGDDEITHIINAF